MTRRIDDTGTKTKTPSGNIIIANGVAIEVVKRAQIGPDAQNMKNIIATVSVTLTIQVFENPNLLIKKSQICFRFRLR